MILRDRFGFVFIVIYERVERQLIKSVVAYCFVAFYVFLSFQRKLWGSAKKHNRCHCIQFPQVTKMFPKCFELLQSRT